jgi:uncharacterized protein YecE (DUF72 family)
VIRVGTAGWSYPDWEGRVYPKRKPPGFHPLQVLSRCFDGVEVNSTFYAEARSEVVAKWAEQVKSEPQFHFIVKLHQSFTHEHVDLAETAPLEFRALAFQSALEPLTRAGILDGVLVQFPTSFHEQPDNVRRLGLIRSLLAELPLILEVRHRSWFEPPAMASIRGLGYSLAHIDLPDAWDHPPKRFAPTGPIGYLRLHGRNRESWFNRDVGRDERYDYLYTPAEVGALAKRADEISQEVDQTWVVTNNHFEGQAFANALEFKWLFNGRQSVPAPDEVVEAFPHLAEITEPRTQGGLFDG